MEVTQALAQFATEVRFEEVPQKVRWEGSRSLLNWLGCAIGGSQHETVERAIAALGPFSGAEQASVLGRNERLDIMHAALVNGISSHVFDYDDTHLKTLIHPSGPVASAILALAEYQPVSGASFLHAFIVGVEVECRIGRAVFPAHYDIGWHITGTAGVFGAAAAAGKLLGLDAQQMAWALGIAGTQSSGFREMFGTMCKSFHPGRAAQNGLAAAYLAQQNFTSSNHVLEAPRGFANVMSTSRDLTRITEGLGQNFEIMFNTYKPYACGLVIHPAIDGCVQLRNEHGLSANDIAHIDLKVHPLVLELTGKKTPQSGLEGKFSVFHSVAIAIIYGMAGEREYSDERVQDPHVVELRSKVDAHVVSDIGKGESIITITLTDGRKLQNHIQHVIGSLERPMSDTDLETKFRDLTESILPADRTEHLMQMCWHVDTLEDAAEIARGART